MGLCCSIYHAVCLQQILDSMVTRTSALRRATHFRGTANAEDMYSMSSIWYALSRSEHEHECIQLHTITATPVAIPVSVAVPESSHVTQHTMTRTAAKLARG